MNSRKSIRVSFDGEPVTHAMQPHGLREIVPYGLGTSQIESLSSYITRLAEAHWMATSPFVRVVLQPLVPANYDFKGSQHSATYYLANGYGKYAAALSAAVSRERLGYRGRDLTFLPWLNAFDRKGHGLVRSHLCWCIECWREDRERSKTPYVRLIWLSQQVSVCTLHNRELEQFCPECGEGQNVMPSIPQAWVCQACGAELFDGNLGKLLNRGVDHPSMWSASVINRLLERTCGIEQDIEPGMVGQVLGGICDREYGGSVSQFRKQLNAELWGLKNWIAGKTMPSLPVFLDLAYRLGVPPDVLLLDPSEPLLDLQSWRLKPNQRFVAMHKLSEKEKASLKRKVIKIVKRAEEPPPTLSEVAKRCGSSISVIRYHFPSEYEIIQKRSLNWRDLMKSKAERERLARVVRGARELVAQGIYPSERRLREFSYVRPSDLRREGALQALVEIQTQHDDLPLKIYSRRLRDGSRTLVIKSKLDDKYTSEPDIDD